MNRVLALCVCVFLLCACLDAVYARFEYESGGIDEVDHASVSRFDSDRGAIERYRKDSFPMNEENSVEENCTKRSIEEFPEDLFTAEQRRHGAVLLHTFFGLYCFLLTAFICNDYLLPSLDCICSGLNISPDVAGATFLATANCFPELFVNVVGTFLTESDLGVGTVLGGAVFNTFATPACGALSALHAIQLEWRILTRDCIIYVLSVGTLVIVMWDGLIAWYEATLLMALFFGYLVLLFCSKALRRWYAKTTHLCWGSTKTVSKPNSPVNEPENDRMSQGMYRPYFHNELIAEYRKSITKLGNSHANTNAVPGKQDDIVESFDYSEPDSPFTWPKGGALAKFWFLFTWPLKFVLFITIPDCRLRRFQRWYFLTFVMCIVWIAIASYLTSWMMTVLGDTMGIADSIMGITFLSAGGNMPEVVSIVILSRQGNGDMAMSNTLGANTLDILLCLGLPWTIKTIITGQDIQIVSGTLTYSVLSIIVCVVAFYLVTAFYKFTLNKKVGAICLLLYTIFLVFAILIELNVFFFVNLPMCKG